MTVNNASPYNMDFPQGSALKILVVEDDQLLRMILTKMLSGAADLRVACDGIDAWEQYQAAPPDILVTDWMMPRMSGVDLCRLVKASSSFCYVILMTARDQFDDKLDALECGADEYLIKPVDPREFFARLKAGARIVASNRRLTDESRTDKLTGLKNRRAFEEALAHEMAMSERNRKPFCLLLGDVNGFKSVNDTYGHAVGDRTLSEVGAAMTRALRTVDTVFRIGGDEFAALLPDCQEAGGLECVARLEAAMKSLRLPKMGEAVGMSLGVGVFDPNRPTSIEALIKQADGRMYGMKRAAR